MIEMRRLSDMISRATYFLLGMGTFSLIISVSICLAKLSGGKNNIGVAQFNTWALVFFVVALSIAAIDKKEEPNTKLSDDFSVFRHCHTPIAKPR